MAEKEKVISKGRQRDWDLKPDIFAAVILKTRNLANMNIKPKNMISQPHEKEESSISAAEINAVGWYP